MPIYEYRCKFCDEELEKLQRLNEKDPVDCPACGKPGLKRLISAGGFRLKGSGWYETDFKKGEKRNVADRGSKDESPCSTCPAAAAAGKSGGSCPTDVN